MPRTSGPPGVVTVTVVAAGSSDASLPPDLAPVADIRRFEKELLEYLHRKEQGLMTSIREGGKMSDDTLQAVAVLGASPEAVPPVAVEGSTVIALPPLDSVAPMWNSVCPPVPL